MGTAAYLNVFGSIYEALKELKREGYEVGELPGSVEELVDEILHDKEARIASPELNIAYKMTVNEYKARHHPTPHPSPSRSPLAECKASPDPSH